MMESKNLELSRPQNIPSGIDPETYDPELYKKCVDFINESHGKATDGRLNRPQMVKATLEMYKEKLAEKLCEQ